MFLIRSPTIALNLLPLMEEETAYHEAGHAFMAILLGGRIESLTIAPEQDDAVPRYGEIRIAWPTTQVSASGNSVASSRQHLQTIEKVILSALGGPVSEMIILGEKRHPGFVPEWAHDWEVAWEAAAHLVSDHKRRLKFLEKVILDLHTRLSIESNWAAVAAIVDHLLAFESLEDEEIREIVDAWI